MMALSPRDIAIPLLLLAALHMMDRITAGTAAVATGEIALERPR